MRGYIGLRTVMLTTFCFASVACAGSTPPVEEPSSKEVAQRQTEPSIAEPMGGNQSLEVGMQYEDKDDTRRSTSHDAPPTSSWKPVEKDKAADLKKRPVTAAR